MKIDIISDTVCPWCFVGKRRLEKALAAYPEINPTITWHPFQLNPDMPAGGLDRKKYLESKFGGPDGAKRVYDTIREAGNGEGIAFDFDAIEVTPNSIDSHRVIHWADNEGKQDAVVEALFRGYFVEGANISDPEILAATAESCGMDGAVVTERLAGDSDRTAIVETAQRASTMGISGVPSFVVESKYVISGAQDPAYFAQLFDTIAAEGEDALTSTG